MSALSNARPAVPFIVAVLSRRDATSERRRSINPQAGRALELLGHAIEYLTDEFVHQGGSLCVRDPRLEAIQLLMARNREVYLACPEVPSVRERLRAPVHAILTRLRTNWGSRLVHLGRAAR